MEVLREEQKRIQAFQSKEKEQLACVLERVACLEETCSLYSPSVRNNEAKSSNAWTNWLACWRSSWIELNKSFWNKKNAEQEPECARCNRGPRPTCWRLRDNSHYRWRIQRKRTSLQEADNEPDCTTGSANQWGQPRIPVAGRTVESSQRARWSSREPGKTTRAREYSVTEELQQTVEFNSITRQNEMDDCEGTREQDAFDAARFTDRVQYCRTHESSYIMCEENSWRGAAG